MEPATLRAWQQALEEAIHELSGIRLDARAGSWRAEGDALLLEDDAGVVLELDLAGAEGPEDAHQVLDEQDLRYRLTEARLALLERRTRDAFQEALEDVLGEDDWDLEYVDAGHWPSHHGEVEDEYVRDYGQLGVQLTLAEDHPLARGDEDEDSFHLRLDAYQEPFYDEGDLEELVELLAARS